MNGFVMTLSCVLLAVFQPFKNNLHNSIELIAMLALSLFYWALYTTLTLFYLDTAWEKLGFVMLSSAVLLFTVYTFIVLSIHCKLHIAILKLIKRKLEERINNAVPSEDVMDSLERGHSCSTSAEHAPLLLAQDMVH